ncbi:molybdate ABC transporter substrate-binding protein [Cupriavidus cauae]|uniref:molybdate ABC transporter substrate-binding protein n=1 Tax=Cupriavidus cauae TaxID=2608999 RepID=UPI003898FA70|nr:molybdate ABC transporter substrate-binding protein [Cupriavidus cauae]
MPARRSPAIAAAPIRARSRLSGAFVAAALAMLAILPARPAAAAELVVSAAASLTNAFRAVATTYEQAHPGTKLVLNFGASDVLMQQIVQGAPADVFASADQQAMDKAQAEHVIVPGSRRDFAANALVLVEPADSTLKLASPRDLLRDDVRRVTYGNPASVPVGRYTRDALEDARLWQAVSAKGVPAQNARQALDYVARGEVDAGFVFATDAAVTPGRVRVVAHVPTRTAVTYPIAVTARSRQKDEAARFVDFVLSSEGQALLARHGFRPR